MQFTQEESKDGVTERLFEVTVAGQVVPGVMWTPDGAHGPRPLLLMGHGGGAHKMFPPLAAAGRRYAKEQHYAVVAIDAPDHGARATPEATASFSQQLREHLALGGGLGGEPLKVMLLAAVQAVSEWRAVLDRVQALGEVGAGGPTGYLGLSKGAMTGILLAASDARIKAAVFGLTGGAPQLEEAARQISIPVEFVAQWDDELMPRAAALALFDAIGSSEKTLHANPGGHGGIPPFERAGWAQFFKRHLGSGAM
ncbi:MAG TPA: hypothetical protein VFG03_04815 [Telluria sp.]|nr:hypothetical protein [Telluria sp.]